MLADVSEKPYFNPVSGFTKLFSSLIFSTVWREEMHVKVVWITMLAMANRNGEVLASIPGLADAARVSLDQCQDALARLGGPDTYSRTKEHEGRRIIEVDGGWRLLNYPKYREIRDADERRIQTREAVRAHRARKAEALTVSQGKPRKAQAEAEVEAEADAEKKSKALVALKRDGRANGSNGKHGQPLQAVIQELQEVGLKTDSRLTKDVFRGVMVKIVFSYWAKRLGHDEALFDQKRDRTIRQRLVENQDNLSELLYAVDGALKDDWVMGRDAKSQKRFDGIEHIFQDRAHVEKFAITIPQYRSKQQHPMAIKYAR